MIKTHSIIFIMHHLSALLSRHGFQSLSSNGGLLLRCPGQGNVPSKKTAVLWFFFSSNDTHGNLWMAMCCRPCIRSGRGDGHFFVLMGGPFLFPSASTTAPPKRPFCTDTERRKKSWRSLPIPSTAGWRGEYVQSTAKLCYVSNFPTHTTNVNSRIREKGEREGE